MAINCDERVKSLGNQMENLSMAPMCQSLVFENSNHDFEHPRHVGENKVPEVGAAVMTGTEDPEQLQKELKGPVHPDGAYE